MIKKQLKQRLGCLILCLALACGLTCPAAAAGFTDVPASHWAAADIDRCVKLGFFQGESASRFGVGHPMTRAAFAVVLSRFFGWTTTAPTKAPFTDVPANAWYAGAVQAAYDHGAVTNQRAEFRPADPITREELAVMLVRALGYGAIAGLAQDLPSAFQDVTTNAGYITMVCDLGLMGGTSATTFAPSRTAPREQVAVILMRLYDRLHSARPGRVGILAAGEETPSLSGWDAVALSGGQLVGVGGAQVVVNQDTAQASQVRTDAHAAGAKALLYVKGGPSALNSGAAETARSLADAAADWDGLYLDIPALKMDKSLALTRLIQALRPLLNGKLLYLAVEAPAWQATQYTGYDYAALAPLADKLVLRIASYAPTDGADYPAAPVEPLEELYYALAELRDKVDTKKLSVLTTSEVSVWAGGRHTTSVDGQELTQLYTQGKLSSHYSDRYGCAYLSGQTADKRPLIAWYLDRQSIAARERLLGLFGVNQMAAASVTAFPGA